VRQEVRQERAQYPGIRDREFYVSDPRKGIREIVYVVKKQQSWGRGEP